MAKVKTKDNNLDAAAICRANGWKKGTRLRGFEDRRVSVIEITAVGRYEILAVEVGEESEREMLQDLSCREWKEVPKP